MVKREFTFPSRDGKTFIHAVEWLPEGGVSAILQLSHGIAEHIGRYEPLAVWLTGRGFAVVGNDHLGHGQSVAQGAPPMFFGPLGSWRAVVDDLYTLRDYTGHRFPHVPYFLLGHSMGSFLVRTYLICYPGTLSGAVLMGTGWLSAPVLACCDLLAARELHRVGETGVSPVVNRLSFDQYNKPFAPNRTAYDWLSVNSENVDSFLSDPLCGGDATIGLCREMLRGIRLIQKPANLRRMDRRTPVLFLSGAEDPVGNFGKGVRRTVRAFQKSGVLEVQCKLYPDARHEILRDNCRETVERDLYQWLSTRISPLRRRDGFSYSRHSDR